MNCSESPPGSESATTRSAPSAKISHRTPDGLGCTLTLQRAHTPCVSRAPVTHAQHADTTVRSRRLVSALQERSPLRGPRTQQRSSAPVPRLDIDNTLLVSFARYCATAVREVPMPGPLADGTLQTTRILLPVHAILLF